MRAQMLDELLVGVGIDTRDLTAGTAGAADDVERSLAGVGDAGDRLGRDLVQVADDAEAALNSVGDAAGQAAADADQAAAGIGESLGGAGAGAAVAGAAVGGLFIAGLTNAMDASAANTRLANQLDLSEAEAERAGDTAGAVFSAGFGESIDEVNESLGAVVSSVGGMGKATDAELDQMTRSALALADTFQFDVAESTQAVGTLIKTGMVKDGIEGFDLLTAAAQELPAKLREEIPALTNEYGEFFDQLGFTGPDMMGLLAEAAKNPVFELDKVGDAIKELSLRLADTKAVEEPLKDLGLSVADIQKQVNTGQGTKAFDDIVTALKGVDNQTERTALQAALFGGPGEDMGNTLLALSADGAAAANGLDDVAGAAKEVTDSVAASQSLNSIWRSLATTLGELLAPALGAVADFFAENPTLLKILVPVVLGLAAAIAIATIAQWAWNTALWAFPGTWIVAGIIALIAAIVLIAVYWDEIAAATGDAWDWITGKLGTAWDWITSKLGSAWDWVTAKTGAAWDWVTGKVATAVGGIMAAAGAMGSIPGMISGWWNQVIAWLTGLPGRIARATAGMWDGIKASFADAINFVIWKWNSLSFTIGGGSIMGVGIPSVTLSTPDIPYLAEGGITTGPTLAMIGEGPEQEAVLPLSRLDGMLRGVAGAVRSTGGSSEQRVVLEFVGADSEFVDFFRAVVRNRAGGSVARLAGED